MKFHAIVVSMAIRDIVVMASGMKRVSRVDRRNFTSSPPQNRA